METRKLNYGQMKNQKIEKFGRIIIYGNLIWKQETLVFAGNGSWVLNGRRSEGKAFPKFIKTNFPHNTENSIKFKSLQK
jgi:hypothetical protein